MPLKLIPPKEGRSPNYFIRGTYLKIRVYRSAGTADRAKAAKELARVKKLIEEGRWRDEPGVTFASAVVEYLRQGGEDRFLKPLLEHFGETPIEDIDQRAVDLAAVEVYPDATPATRNRQVYTPMSAVLAQAGRELRLKRPKGSAGKGRTDWHWPDEAARLVAAARERDPEFGAFLVVLIYTGLRLSEALELRRRDLRLDESFVYCGKTKNGSPRAVHLPPEAVEALRGLPEHDDGRLFRFNKNGHLYRLMREVAKTADVKKGFHTLRHTYATWMRRYGGLDAQGLVGTGAWRDTKSAAVYAHVVPTEEARKADTLPRLSMDKSVRNP